MSRYSLGVFAEKTDVKPQMVELPKCWKVTIIIIALIAIAALVIAICKSFPRLDLGFDYMGIIVAIFSTIVTLLLGWQIWNTIKAKEELKEFQRLTENIKTSTNKSLEEHKQLIYGELYNLCPIYLSINRDIINKLSVNFNVFRTSNKNSVLARSIAYDTILNGFDAISKENDDVKNNFVSEIKRVCDHSAIKYFYSEFCASSEDEQKKYAGVNSLLLRLLEDDSVSPKK